MSWQYDPTPAQIELIDMAMRGECIKEWADCDCDECLDLRSLDASMPDEAYTRGAK